MHTLYVFVFLIFSYCLLLTFAESYSSCWLTAGDAPPNLGPPMSGVVLCMCIL